MSRPLSTGSNRRQQCRLVLCSRLILLFGTLQYSIHSTAQKHASTWYFANCQGIRFSTGSAVPVAGPICTGGGQEGTSVLCDSSGNVLLSCDGMTIWNRAGQAMQNGTGLLGHTSSTQSSLIIPDPADPDRYFYVFTLSSGMVLPGAATDGLRFSKVDMCLDQGNGAVMTSLKNVKLTDSISEKLAACRHANGTDYWIVTHRFDSDKFVAFRLSASGISQTVTSSAGSYHGGSKSQTIGQMKISHNRKKIAIGAANGANILDLLDFDPATGIVSNAQALLKPNGNSAGVYGIEFSPDNTKLYCQGATSSGVVNNLLWQYDLSAGGGNINAINSSIVILETVGGLAPKGLQLGPDMKIYRPNISPNTWLGVIGSPNTAGIACGFNPMSISVGTAAVGFCCPSFVVGFDYSNTLSPAQPATITSVSSTLSCSGANVVLTSSGPGTHTWSTGQTGTLINVTPTVSTTYTVANSHCMSSSVAIQVEACASLREKTLQSLIGVFPNPADERITLVGETNAHFDILDQLGSVVFSGRLTENSEEITLNKLKPGLYFVRITGLSEIRLHRFIKRGEARY